ncbi:AAA family ATPase [Histomonas meleagridis]|uniref:AAA family ATPase n=1 Tax=Histomonas meleagridis TaxID=135588 RepID=UPI00355A58AA|nr:AAA family ATPase [Histomonas meleagridis]KAH0799918.1 AAA family ATPase [Histomonas meleagridis]
MSPDGPVSILNISTHHGLAISRVNVIIVDEVTMLDRSVINAVSKKLIDLCGYTGNHIQIPFAKKIVIFLGDPSQVPAVTHTHDDISECAEQFMHITGFDGFIPIHSKKLMRQNDPSQEQFRNLLDEVSKMTNDGHLSDVHQAMLRSSFHQENITEDQSIQLAFNHASSNVFADKSMIITYTNDRANIFNQFGIITQNSY